MSETNISIDPPIESPRRCHISISDKYISIDFEPPAINPKPTRVDLMAAGALLGMAGILIGKTQEELMGSLVKLSGDARKKGSRR